MNKINPAAAIAITNGAMFSISPVGISADLLFSQAISVLPSLTVNSASVTGSSLSSTSFVSA